MESETEADDDALPVTLEHMPNEVQLNNDLDGKLQHASAFGKQLAAALEDFVRELDVWRLSIASLQNAGTPGHSHLQNCAVVNHHGLSPTSLPDPMSNDSRGKKDSPVTSPRMLKRSHSQQDLIPELCSIWTTHVPRDSSRLPSIISNTICLQDVENPTLSVFFALPFSYFDKFVIDPLSNQRHFLDAMSMIILISDMIVFPLAAFGFDETVLAQRMSLITSIYWSVDILLSFFEGYELRKGQIEKRFWATSKKFVQTRACFDVTVVAIDWALYVMDSTRVFASFARLSKTARLLRLFRLLRLMRIVKLRALLDKLNSMPFSAALSSFLNVTMRISEVMIINHFFGCGWYAVGNANDEYSWVLKYLDSSMTMFERYLISFQWCIAQFTPCPSNVYPVNLDERLYALIMLIFGLVLYASLIGKVTAIVNASGKRHYEELKKSQDLKEFLAINKIPSRLSARIQSYLRLHRITKTRVLESDVPSLTTLSSSLRKELHFAAHGRLLQRHPVFRMLPGHSMDCSVDVSSEATRLTTLAFGDEIFSYRSNADSMFMPLSGLLEYRQGGFDSEKIPIEKGGWLSEPPLWISWENRGLLTVGAQTDVVIIDASKFQKAVSLHNSAYPFLKNYAFFFARHIAIDAEEKKTIDDLWGTSYCSGGRMTSILDHVDSLKAALEEFDNMKAETDNSEDQCPSRSISFNNDRPIAHL